MITWIKRAWKENEMVKIEYPTAFKWNTIYASTLIIVGMSLAYYLGRLAA